tara:strand:- start:41 stop:595 length:555 start_codon:yes stop_codon:yes gene_type:complete
VPKPSADHVGKKNGTQKGWYHSMTIPITVTSWLPRPAVKYHGCYQKGFEKYLKTWLGTENYIHLFAGLSKTGYRVDINASVEPDLVANCENLPLADNIFNGGMADPPYNEEFSKNLYNCKYPKWSKWTSELVRVCKPKSKIGIMQNYICPLIPKCNYHHIYFIPTRIKQFPKVVTVYEKELALQ